MTYMYDLSWRHKVQYQLALTGYMQFNQKQITDFEIELLVIE